jgi:hypothetical protein
MYTWTALLAYSAMLLGIFPSWITLGIVVAVVVSTLVFVIATGRKTSVSHQPAAEPVPDPEPTCARP